MGQRPTESHDFIHENENMCRVILNMSSWLVNIKPSHNGTIGLWSNGLTKVKEKIES